MTNNHHPGNISRCKKAAASAKEGLLTSAAVEAIEVDEDEVDAVLEAVQQEQFEDNFDHASA